MYIVYSCFVYICITPLTDKHISIDTELKCQSLASALYGTIISIHTYLFAISAAARISLNSPAILATPRHPNINPMMH